MKTQIKLTIILLLGHIAINAWAQKDSASESVPAVRSGTSGQLSATYIFLAYQTIVDKDYLDKNYEDAFEGYLRLAQVSDKFSQYRVAFMYAHGLGVEKDLIESYAWSRVSRENKPGLQDEFQDTYDNFNKTITNLIAEEDLDEAKALAQKYRLEFGTYRTAVRAYTRIQKESRQCTGSLLTGGCDGAQRITTLAFTGNSSGGNFSGNGICQFNKFQIPNQNCLLFGSVGLPGVVGVRYQTVRGVIKDLEQRIELYNPGNVELRDLEVIEDGSESN